MCPGPTQFIDHDPTPLQQFVGSVEQPSASEIPNRLTDSVSTLQDSTEVLDSHAPTVIDASRLEVDFDNADKRIGIGTYGAVYVGSYFGELVAVKRIRMPDTSAAIRDDPHIAARRSEAIRQFAREIRRYERVSHPGIVRFLGVTLPPDASALLITELMPGGSLGAALSTLRRVKVPLTISSALRIALHACGGLRALHNARCTWGDGKPENVLLSSSVDTNGEFPDNAEARISDFGLSRSVGQSLLADTTVSGTGQPVGTYNYMAPETLSGLDTESDDIAKASDIYSFGLIMYEMLTLRVPWRRLQPMDVNRKVMNGERPAWPTNKDDDFYHAVPDDLRALVERCWNQGYGERPSAEQVFNALENYHVSMSKADTQRPVSDIAGGPHASEVTYGQWSNGVPRVSSKQSNASTAIAIGDSVDMTGVGLESSRGSVRYAENSEDEGQMTCENMPAFGESGSVAPRVSPVTSPEPRSINARNHARNGAHSQSDRSCASLPLTQERRDHREQMRQSAVASSIGSAGEVHIANRRAAPATLHDSIQRDPGSFSKHDGGQNQTNDMSKSIFNQFSNNDNGRAQASKFLDSIDGMSRPKSTTASPQREEQARSYPKNEGATVENPLGAYTLDGSIQDLTSSTASVATQRRRSKKLQTLVERAVESYLEIQRKEEEEKIPPKQRRELADKRAQEEAKLAAENKALTLIQSAREVGDFSTVLYIMKCSRDSHAIAKAALSLLVPFCKDENLFFDVCEEGGVEEMVSAISMFGASDPGLCVLFCTSMTSLSEHYDDKVGHLLRGVGVPTMVIELLDFHKTNISVQTAGCDCLAVIAGTSELSRSAVATLGGPAVVYRAMTKNNSSFRDVNLARAALKAVRQIAQDNEKAAEYLVQVAALDTVSRAAEVFTDHGLEADILAALRGFSFYNGGRRNIIMSSGLKALTAIMLRNRDPDFLVHCCTFIRAIARWRDLECEEAMLQSCISERITSLMQMSNDILGEEGARVAWYSTHACTFLASFGSRSRQRLRLVGAIETSLGVLNNRKENARVVHSATDALAELIKGEPEAKVYAEKCNAVPSLTAALELHSSIVKVRTALQWTLDYLTSSKDAAPGPAYGSRVYNELMNNVQSSQTNANEDVPLHGISNASVPQKPVRKFMGFRFTRKTRNAHN